LLAAAVVVVAELAAAVAQADTALQQVLIYQVQ
jgi:hypothetical protein